MKQKRTKSQALEDEEETFGTKFFRAMKSDSMNEGQGTSSQNVHEEDDEASGSIKQDLADSINILHSELTRPEINVQEVGRIIAEGMISGHVTEIELKELAKLSSKNVQAIGNINVLSLADELNKGVIDSRYVLIGNAFLWNLLKSGMSNVRDKFDNFNFKLCSMNDQQVNKIDMNSKNLGADEFIVEPEGLFQQVDLLAIFQGITFRKSADLIRKAKQIVKTYMIKATYPKCAIWHYGLRLSGSSHKKTIQDFPSEIVKELIDFLLALIGLGRKEFDLNFTELDPNSFFYASLGDSDGEKIQEFFNLKNLKDSLTGKFRVCIAEALNEVREMPFNIRSRELQPPPRGKPLDSHCVTWKQYEELIKKCVDNPSTENLKAKEEIEVQLEYDVVDPMSAVVVAALTENVLKMENEKIKTEHRNAGVES